MNSVLSGVLSSPCDVCSGDCEDFGFFAKCDQTCKSCQARYAKKLSNCTFLRKKSSRFANFSKSIISNLDQGYFGYEYYNWCIDAVDFYAAFSTLYDDETLEKSRKNKVFPSY